MNRRENGQLLIIVIIIMFLGALAITPGLELAESTLTHAGKTEVKTIEYYAADSGINYAESIIKNNEIPNGIILPISDSLNGKDISLNVDVVINSIGVASNDFEVIVKVDNKNNVELTNVSVEITRNGSSVPYVISSIGQYNVVYENDGLVKLYE